MSADTPRNYKDLENQVEDLKLEVEALRNSIEALVDAWNTAKGVTAFIKWVGSISTGLGILYALWHGTGKQ